MANVTDLRTRAGGTMTVYSRHGGSPSRRRRALWLIAGGALLIVIVLAAAAVIVSTSEAKFALGAALLEGRHCVEVCVGMTAPA